MKVSSDIKLASESTKFSKKSSSLIGRRNKDITKGFQDSGWKSDIDKHRGVEV